MRVKTPLFAVIGMLLALSSAGMQRSARYPLLPNSKLTPGDTLDVTKQDVCTPGYAHKVRNVPEEVKRQVYQEYGIAHHQPGEYEVDHLISLELGGSNSLRNLWPQSYKSQPWNAHVKDKLENELHRKVCAGEIDLKTAQNAIASNWITAYKRYVGSGSPVASTTKGGLGSRIRQAIGSVVGKGSVKVWVNTRSGVYWRPGTTYYGKTKQGKYMKEADAVKQGYHAAK